MTYPKLPLQMLIILTSYFLLLLGIASCTAREDSSARLNVNERIQLSNAGPTTLAPDQVSSTSTPAQAPTSQPSRLLETVTLDSIIAAALSAHPGISAAREQVAAASNRIPQSGALPDPVLGTGFWPVRKQSPQTASGRVANTMSLMQRVPWPEKLNAEEAVAAQEVQMARAELLDTVQEIEKSAKLAYYELWLYQETKRIVVENKALLENLIAVSTARYRAGGAQQDVVRAELEADKLEDQLITLHRQQEEAIADLGVLVRKPLRIQIGNVAEPRIEETSLDLEKLVALTRTCNPTLKLLRAEKSRDRESHRLASLQNYPDFEIGVNWSHISDEHDVLSPVADGQDSVGINLGITLPIWREKIVAAVNEAFHTLERTDSRRKMRWDQLRGNLRRYAATADALRKQELLLEKKLIPRTQQNLELATSDYRSERGDFLGVIDVYQELLAHELQLARTKAHLAGTIAQIKRTVGCY